MNYNKIILVGRLCMEPAEKRTKNTNKPYAGFNFAVDDGYGKNAEPSFFHVRVWGKAGEIVLQYCHKGSEVLIEGSLKQERWVDERDPNNPVKRERVIINAWTVELGARAEQKTQRRPPPETQAERSTATQPKQDSFIEADDVPF